jgi:flagellar hook-basal body complex protein FliE
MTIEAIAAVSAGTFSPVPGLDASVESKGFAQWVNEELQAVNKDMIVADQGVRHLAMGDPVNLHQVMINLERAKLRFDLLLQVRNKLLEAYQDVARMQI